MFCGFEILPLGRLYECWVDWTLQPAPTPLVVCCMSVCYGVMCDWTDCKPLARCHVMYLCGCMNKGEPESRSMPESRWCAWCCVSCGPVRVRLRAILIGCWGSCVHVMHVQVVLLGLFMSFALCSTSLSIYLVTNWVIVSILFWCLIFSF